MFSKVQLVRLRVIDIYNQRLYRMLTFDLGQTNELVNWAIHYLFRCSFYRNSSDKTVFVTFNASNSSQSF